METLWVLGIGPILTDAQFAKDIYRRDNKWFLNDMPLPKDPYDALRIIYEDCGTKYYIFTKYINQTMGNMMYEHVKRMHCNAPMTQVPKTYVIRAYSKPYQIYASIQFQKYDTKLRPDGRIDAECIIDIENDQTLIKVNIL